MGLNGAALAFSIQHTQHTTEVNQLWMLQMVKTIVSYHIAWFIKFHMLVLAIILDFFFLFPFRPQCQGSLHILPYMAAMCHPGADPPGRSEVTPFSVISEANIQSRRLWAVPSTSNHQRFMHPESSGVPPKDCRPQKGRGYQTREREKNKRLKSYTKSNKEDALSFCLFLFVFFKENFTENARRRRTLDIFTSTTTGRRWMSPDWRNELPGVEGGQFVKHKNHFTRRRKTQRRKEIQTLLTFWIWSNISLLTNTFNQTFLCVSLSSFSCTRCQSPTLVFHFSPASCHSLGFLYLLGAVL